MKTVIYSKYSNERNSHLSIRTEILEDENKKRYVRKLAEFPEGKAHAAGIYHWYQVFSDMCKGTALSYNHCELIKDGVELEYLTGETLEEALLKSDSCEAEFLQYLNFVRELHQGAVFEVTPAFETVFGKTELRSGTVCAPATNIDLICSNLLLTEGGLTAIDYEWSFEFPIPVNYLLYRIIFYFTEHAKRYELRNFDFLGKMGITAEEVREFEKMETAFQKYVCHGHVPIRDLYGDISEGSYQIEEAMNKEVLQVFFDYGEGVSEANSKTYPMENWGIQKIITLPEGVRSLRVDPGSSAGVVELKGLKFDQEEKRVPFTLREGAVIGNWLYLGDSDPNILISEIPQGAKTLEISLKVYPIAEIPMEKIERVAKEYVKQKQQIREMENTKVWKLYRKYRAVKERGVNA